MDRKRIKKSRKKLNRKRQKRTTYDNPFNDLSFWLTIATTDFSFGLFGNAVEPKVVIPKVSNIIFEKEE